MLTESKGEARGRIHQTGNGYYHVSRVDIGKGQRVEVVLGTQELYGSMIMSPAEMTEFIKRLIESRDLVIAEHERVARVKERQAEIP